MLYHQNFITETRAKLLSALENYSNHFSYPRPSDSRPVFVKWIHARGLKIRKHKKNLTSRAYLEISEKIYKRDKVFLRTRINPYKIISIHCNGKIGFDFREYEGQTWKLLSAEAPDWGRTRKQNIADRCGAVQDNEGGAGWEWQ